MIPSEFIDHEMIILSLQSNPFSISYILDMNMAKPEYIFYALDKNPSVIQYIPVTHPMYRKFCKTALAKDGYVLKYIDEKQKDDKLYDIAICSNGEAMYLLPESARTHKRYETALKTCGRILLIIPDDMNLDPSLIPEIKISHFCLTTRPCKHNVQIGNYTTVMSIDSIRNLVKRWNVKVDGTHFNHCDQKV